MKIEKANSEDSEELTALTIRSKSYWGYPQTQIEEWREELTVTESYITENKVFKIGNEAVIMGFYSYHPLNDHDVKLEFLFITPEHIGKGLGKTLMDDFLVRAEREGFKTATLDADPHAEEFYKKQGFTIVGQLQSSIKDRFFPILKRNIHLKQDAID